MFGQDGAEAIVSTCKTFTISKKHFYLPGHLVASSGCIHHPCATLCGFHGNRTWLHGKCHMLKATMHGHMWNYKVISELYCTIAVMMALYMPYQKIHVMCRSINFPNTRNNGGIKFGWKAMYTRIVTTHYPQLEIYCDRKYFDEISPISPLFCATHT